MTNVLVCEIEKKFQHNLSLKNVSVQSSCSVNNISKIVQLPFLLISSFIEECNTLMKILILKNHS